MAAALVLLAPGFEEIEAVTIIDLLRRGSVKVTTAGLQNGLVCGSHDIYLKADVYYRDVDPGKFDMIILPGGQPGTNNLKADPLVIQWLQSAFKEGKLLAAICAAPTVFHSAGITRGFKLTSYPSEKDTFSNSEYLSDNVVRDRNIYTSRGVGTAIDFSLALIKELIGTETAEDVRKKILHTTSL